MSTYIQEIRQALAVTITDEDIKELVETSRKKALHNAAITAELRSAPGSNGKASFCIEHNYSLYLLWRNILMGTYNQEKGAVHPHPFISPETSVHWMRIIFNTIDKHFCGEIAEVGKINALNYLNRFVYDPEEDQPPTNENYFSLACAAQVLLCYALPCYWVTVTSGFVS